MDRTGLSNIVLIGMPGSGKTSVGSRLARRIGRPFLDSDVIFMDRYGNIREFFAQYGEEEFRNRESEINREMASVTSTVIATGGGVVIREENMEALKKNGLIVWLQRDFDKIDTGNDRPLLKDPQAWGRLYQQRKALYEAYCDVTVENNGTFKSAVDRLTAVMEEFGLI